MFLLIFESWSNYFVYKYIYLKLFQLMFYRIIKVEVNYKVDIIIFYEIKYIFINIMHQINFKLNISLSISPIWTVM
jgi:hypothetical protein